MKTLYSRLSQIGLPESYVRKLALPDWWDKEFEKSSSSVPEAVAYISRRLNLDFNSLLKQDHLPVFDQSYKPKFKVQQGTNNDQLKVAYALAIRVAEIVVYACSNPYQPIEKLTVQDIRSAIFQYQKYVSLEGLLIWCWDRGIPVIHFNEYPSGRKFHGMAVYCHSQEYEDGSSRPVIVISLKHLSPSKLLFILAHELGHVFKGHIASDSFLIDEKVDLSNDDREEIEANEFAVELLTGNPNTQYQKTKRLTGDKLAEYSRQMSLRDSVDPGVVANNYGWHMQRAGLDCWGAVVKALKVLERDANAPEIINRYLNQHIDWDCLSDDSQEYLEAALRLALEDGV